MLNKKLLTFSGIDCCGKSTQIKLLSQHLTQEGKKVKSIWFRPGYSYWLDKLRAIVRKTHPSLLPTVAAPQKREKVFSKNYIRVLWNIMAVLDILWLGLRIRLYLILGYCVLLDRYIVDALIDLEIKFPEYTNNYMTMEKLLKIVMPEPFKQYLLVLSIQEVRQRMIIKKEPFPEEETKQRERLKIYENRFSRESVKVINGELSPEKVHQLIYKDILENL